MPRKRMLAPEIWTDEGFIELAPEAKLLFIGLISHADDEGRGIASISSIRAKIFPADKKLKDDDIKNYKEEISKKLRVKFYQVKGRNYYQLDNWGKHQYIRSKKQSIIPNAIIENDDIDNTQMSNENDTSTDKEKKRKEIERKEKKYNHAEHVTLTEKEYKTLLNEYGDKWVKKLIDALNSYKGAHGKKYKSDYMAIKSWVIDKVKPLTKIRSSPKICPECKKEYIGTGCRCGWFESSDAK